MVSRIHRGRPWDLTTSCSPYALLCLRRCIRFLDPSRAGCLRPCILSSPSLTQACALKHKTDCKSCALATAPLLLGATRSVMGTTSRWTSAARTAPFLPPPSASPAARPPRAAAGISRALVATACPARTFSGSRQPQTSITALVWAASAPTRVACAAATVRGGFARAEEEDRGGGGGGGTFEEIRHEAKVR